jgi:hypothetical protein
LETIPAYRASFSHRFFSIELLAPEGVSGILTLGALDMMGSKPLDHSFFTNFLTLFCPRKGFLQLASGIRKRLNYRIAILVEKVI